MLVVALGDEETAGLARSSDSLRLTVGPLAHPSDASSHDGTYLAHVERLDLVVSGAVAPSGEAVTGVIAEVDADLSRARMPLGPDGTLEITCGT